MNMEAITAGLLALNGALVTALIWVVKSLVKTVSVDLKENTRAIMELTTTIKTMRTEEKVSA